MKTFIAIVFATSLMLSSVVISSSVLNDGSFSVRAQQTTVTKKRKPGIARSTYRGGRWVVVRTYQGGRWVTKRVWRGSKWVGKKSWKTGRKVVSRTKKIVY